MPDRIFVYVDGESHYIRSECAWRKLHGEDACLDRLKPILDADTRGTMALPKAKVFWTRRMSPGAQRTVYFTSIVGDPKARHDLMVSMRNFDLEPSVVPELKSLADRRQNSLQNEHLIEKPKEVDIALTVRMVEDAWKDAFDTCHLYTSDVDFVPAIRAIIGRGKQVRVFGYRDGLAGESQLLVAPDQFIDLEEMLRSECELIPGTKPA